MTFSFDLSEVLEKKLKKLAKKDSVLASIFKKKVLEVIDHSLESISTYKNLKSPLHHYKRIHLSSQFILLFNVNLSKKHVVFVDILHWDDVYN
ncbi:MAG: addiction module toxin RelE [Patescibacteria group bacterium]|nr:addiction module toxin RelE [Patescibacteria group bacterium]